MYKAFYGNSISIRCILINTRVISDEQIPDAEAPDLTFITSVLYLIMCPAGLPHAQGFSVRELALETQKNPAVAKQQLKAVLTQPGQMLVEARQHQPQELTQVHLDTHVHRTIANNNIYSAFTPG